MGQPREIRGMTRQKVLATVQLLKNNDNLGDAILVALGALFLLLPFTFYPLYLVPLLAAVAGIAAYKHAPIGTLMGMLFAIPAIAYQAPVLAWVFFIAVAIALFEVFDHWSTIAFLEIAILAPFAPAPFNLLSGFLFLALGIAAMRFGSKHSFAVSLPAIFLVLLFSSLWLQQTASFITISKDQNSLYGPPMNELRNNVMPEVALNDVFSTGAIAIGSLFSIDNMKFFSPALYKIYLNTTALILQDSAIAQLCAWAAALFMCAYLPGHFDHRFKQTISSVSLFFVPIANFIIAPVFNNPFEPMSFAYCSASIAVIAVMEYYGFALSRERIVVRRERQKAFNKFGLQDLGESRGVDSLEDIGGYDDVKAELHEAIIAPLKSQELVYTYGLEPPNGVLLFGPPGTGKTMMMKALAKEMNIGFYYVKCSELLSEFYGESEKNMSEVFAIARKKAPCVSGDTSITLDDGSEITVGELFENPKADARVLSMDSHYKVVPKRIVAMRKMGLNDIVEVITSVGTIRCTPDHLFPVLENGRLTWTRANELNGKSVATPRIVPVVGRPVRTVWLLPAFSKVAGAATELARAKIREMGVRRASEIMGVHPGSLQSRLSRSARRDLFLTLEELERLGFSRDSVEADKAILHTAGWGNSVSKPVLLPELVDEEIAYALGLLWSDGCFEKTGRRVQFSGDHPYLHNRLKQILEGRFGVFVSLYKSKESNCFVTKCSSRILVAVLRNLQARLLTLPVNLMAAWLRGVFDGDGHITADGSKISVGATKEGNRKLLQKALLRVGIPTVDHKGNSLELSSCSQRETYLTKVGFEHPAKVARAQGVVFKESDSKSRLDVIPLGSLISEARIEAGLKRDCLGFSHSVVYGWEQYGTAPSRERAGILCQALRGKGSTQTLLQIEELAHSDMFWAKVVGIRPLDKQEVVYDLQVEETENFMANGMFVHNCVLFFDEIDSIGKRRDMYMQDDIAPRIMSTLLEELDGFKSKKNVITIGATNAPDQLDPALMRPGRFDKIIYMPLPDPDARKAIFKVHLKKLPHDEDLDYAKLAAMTERFSGADIKNICTEGSRLAAREAVQSNVVVNISMKHLTTTIKKLKPTVSLDQHEKYDKFTKDYERRSDPEEKNPDQ